ncbi:MAG: universal stress protein [Anaerolineae bacterium]
MFRKILFANDASPAADRALFYLEHLAREEEAEVIVLHAYERPTQYTALDGYEALSAALESVAQEVVNDAVEHLSGMEILARGVVREGPPARAILDLAQEEKASLIVLGTRGPSNAAELLLGSVSIEVLRFAQCPVLVVP